MADIEQANPHLQIANSPLAFTLHNRQARKLDWFGKSAVQDNGEPMRERVPLIALQVAPTWFCTWYPSRPMQASKAYNRRSNAYWTARKFAENSSPDGRFGGRQLTRSTHCI